MSQLAGNFELPAVLGGIWFFLPTQLWVSWNIKKLLKIAVIWNSGYFESTSCIVDQFVFIISGNCWEQPFSGKKGTFDCQEVGLLKVIPFQFNNGTFLKKKIMIIDNLQSSKLKTFNVGGGGVYINPLVYSNCSCYNFCLQVRGGREIPRNGETMWREDRGTQPHKVRFIMSFLKEDSS